MKYATNDGKPAGLRLLQTDYITPADGEAVADGLAVNPASEPVYGKHLVRVIVLQDVPDRPDRLLVLVQPSGGVEVVQALRVRRAAVAPWGGL